VVHEVLHAVELAQTKPPGQGAVAPALQVPEPLHAPAAVSMAPLHEGEPHDTLLEGYMHPPVPLQPVAPQAPEVAQAAAQQLPVPAVPQTALVHWLLEMHGSPAGFFAVQAPAEQKLLEEAQSASVVHEVLHAVELAQTKPPGQGAVAPALQVPEPLHVLAAVNMAPVHEGEPHDTLLEGYMHPPVPLQPVAPQAPEVSQAIAQQLPMPVVPQTPLVHWLLELHESPAGFFALQAPAEQKLLEDAQSASVVHEVLHAVELAQTKPPGQGAVAPALQVPEPLHAPAAVSMAPLHEGEPHDMLLEG
jgi:hypothetical protein